MPGVYVREAVEEDLEAVASMVARLKMVNEELDPHFKVVDDLEEAAKQYVAEAIGSEDKIVLVAVDEETGKPVGVVIAELVDRVFYKPRLKAVITDFYVLPRYRRRRVGALLVERVAEKAREKGAGILAAVFPAGNNIAREFYSKLGFRDLQVEVYKPLH